MFLGSRRITSKMLRAADTSPIISSERVAQHPLAYSAVLQRDMKKTDAGLGKAQKRQPRFGHYLRKDFGISDDGFDELSNFGVDDQERTYEESRAYVCKGAVNAMANPPYFSPSVNISIPAKDSRAGITFPPERKLKLGVSVGVTRDDHRINRTWFQAVRKGFRFGATGTIENPANILQGEKLGFRVGYMHDPEKLMAMHLYIPMQELQRSMHALGKYMAKESLEPMEWDYLGMHALNMFYSSAQNIAEREKRIRYVEIYLKQLDREFNAAVKAMSTQPYSYLYMDKINEQYRSMRIAAEESLKRYRDASKSASYSLETLHQYGQEDSHASEKQIQMANRYFNRVYEAKDNFSTQTQTDLELCQIAHENHDDFKRRLASEMTNAFADINLGTPEDWVVARSQLKSQSQQCNRRNIKDEVEEILKSHFNVKNLKDIDAEDFHAFFNEALNFVEPDEESDEEDNEVAENLTRDLANILNNPIVRAQNPWLNELVYAIRSVPDADKIESDLSKANHDLDEKEINAETKKQAAVDAKLAYDEAKQDLADAKAELKAARGNASDEEDAVQEAKNNLKDLKTEFQEANKEYKAAKRQADIATKVQNALAGINVPPHDENCESCQHNILKALHHAPHKSVTYRNTAKDAFRHLRGMDGNKGKFMQSDVPYLGAHVKVNGITIGLNPHPQNNILRDILQIRGEDTRETTLGNHLQLDGVSDIRVDIPKANTQKYHKDYLDVAKAFVYMLQWLNGYGQRDAEVNLDSFSHNDSFRLAVAAYCHVYNVNCNPLDKDDICASIDAKIQKANMKLYEQYVEAFEKDLHKENRNSKGELGVPEEKRPGFFKSVGDTVRRGEAYLLQKGVDAVQNRNANKVNISEKGEESDAEFDNDDPFGFRPPRPGNSSDEDDNL